MTKTSKTATPTHRVQGRTRGDGRLVNLGDFYSREEAEAEHARYVLSTERRPYDAYQVVEVG